MRRTLIQRRICDYGFSAIFMSCLMKFFINFVEKFYCEEKEY